MTYNGEIRAAFFEVKSVSALTSFNLNLVRQSQWWTISEASRVGISYIFAIWWQRRRLWTLVDGTKLTSYRKIGRVSYSELQKIAIATATKDLPSVLKSLILADIGWEQKNSEVIGVDWNF